MFFIQTAGAEPQRNKYMQPSFVKALASNDDKLLFENSASSYNISPEEFIKSIMTNTKNEIKPVSEKKDTKPKSSVKFFDKETKEKLDNKLGKGFTAKLEQTAENINCSPKDLLAILCVESALKTDAVNEGHYGLLQISSSRLRSYGTTGAKLIKMDGLEQLDYVEKYFKDKDINPKGKRMNLGDLYAKVFLPGLSKNEVLCRKGSKYYRKNKGLDFDKNGNISKTDLKNAAEVKYKRTLKSL